MPQPPQPGREQSPHEFASGVAVNGKPVVAHPNRGEDWDVTARTWTGRATIAGGHAEQWAAAGARPHLIGGCCRTVPAHVADIAAAVTAADRPETGYPV